MSQWGQPQQPGFQYPMQTGFPAGNPQFQPQNPQLGGQQPQFQQGGPGFQQSGFGGLQGGLQPQPTGFPMQRTGFQQPQQTGFPGGQPMLQAQPTGFVGGNFAQQNRPAPPPVPALPQQFQQQNQFSQNAGMNLQQPQQPNRFLSASPGLVPQQTGFQRPLVAQATGFVDPRLQMLSQTFMPINTSAPYTPGGMPQLPPQQNLQQSFQQYNQDQRGSAGQQISWALSKAEKKNYDKIFRSWDTSGSGFINGSNALEVFGQCGLPQSDLAKIWSLADIDDRGKLNVAEFHVAMGLIYRRLNGNPIPDVLPPELVPPSARDLDSSVDFLKDVLKHESTSRSPSSVDSPTSRAKVRSFNSTGNSLEGRDATIYKHSDAEPPGGFYKPRSRHVDRDAVRRTDDDSPSSDLTDMKRQLANTAHMLDRDAEAQAVRSREDEELDQEMADLKYRVKRVRDDLDYIQRGPRTAAKDEEKRKLERELLSLMHERIPEVERKVQAREERKDRERREWARNRDRANERFGRFDAKEDSYSSRRYDDRDRDRDRNYDRDRPSSRNYDRDGRGSSYRRSRSRSGSRERRDRDRSRDRDYARPRSPPARSAASPAPSSLRPETASRGTPQPARSPAPDLKNMTPEQRRAHAQRLIQERRIALGLDAPASPAPVDTSIEDRLQQEKKEAEEKAKAADKEREERERARNERLERERGPKPEARPAPAAPVPTPTTTAAPPAPTPKAAPPPPKARGAPPPPPPGRGRTAPPKPPAPAPAPVAAPPKPQEPEVDDEEEALRAQLKKQREEKLARLRKQIEEEEAEAARIEEERLKARIQVLKQQQAKPPSPPPAPAAPPAPVAPPPPAVSQSPPAAPPFRGPPSVASPGDKSTNPFRKDGPAAIVSTPSAPPASTNGSTNPWARPQTAPPSSIPAPTRSPAPPAVKTSYHTAPASHADDDWDDIKENEGSDDSSDEDEITRSREARANIAAQLFGGILPRPASAAAVSNGRGSTPSSPAPTSAPPTAPPAPLPPAPPAPPAAPPAPRPPAASAPVPSGPPNVGALMASIQGGARLRPTKTVDKSGPAFSGKVLGDNAPPAHINAAPRPPSPPSPPRQEYTSPAPVAESADEVTSKHDHRQSVDWMSNRAASDVGLAASAIPQLPPMVEEDDYEHVTAPPPAPIPAIQVDEPASEANDLMSDIDKSIQYKVRSLYAYEADGPDDLSFPDNIVLTANPSKTGGDWWFGVLKSGKSGLFPKNYVDVVHPVKAKALYDYNPGNPDELSCAEGDIVTIIDKSEEEWWKAERDGLVLVVPAAYLELVEESRHLGSAEASSPMATEAQNASEQHRERIGTEPREESLNSPESAAKQERPHSFYSQGSSAMEGEAEEEDSDVEANSDSSSDSEYLSFVESEDENDPQLEDTEEERMARERERQRVLEAAGLIVRTDDTVKPPPAKLLRTRSKAYKRPGSPLTIDTSPPRRRQPPEAPARRKPKRRLTTDKDLPPIPLEDEPEVAKTMDPALQLDDAFARYESFKQQQSQETSNRLSIISTDSSSLRSGSPTLVGSFTMIDAPSPIATTSGDSIHGGSDQQALKPQQSQHHLRSNFLNFLSKARSPEPAASGDSPSSVRRLQISGPMPLGSAAKSGGGGATSPRNSVHGGVSSPVASSPRSTHLQPPGMVSPKTSSVILTIGAPSVSGGSVSTLGVEAPSREASPSFGTSWASLVDSSVVETLPTNERKRQEAIFELINTEIAYVRDLQLIVEVFYSSMLEILSHKEITVVFANVEDILLTNTAFLSSLEERQKDCRLYIDKIGDILLNHFPNMGVYLEYCVNQQTANKVLQSLKQSKPALVEHMGKLKENPATRNLDLDSYLLEPMQRITRYPLLIKQIAHYTTASDASDNQEQLDIAEAAKLSERLLGNINETIRDQEGQETLKKLSEGGLWIGQGRLDLTAPTRYMGPRKLVKQGVLAKAKSGRKLKVFLCSDILVLTDQNGRNLYRMPIPLAHAQVKEITHTIREENAFQVVQLYPRGGDSIALKAASPKECRDWMSIIESTSKKCRHAEERAARKGHHPSSSGGYGRR